MHELLSNVVILPAPELRETFNKFELPVSLILGAISIFGSIGNILVIVKFGNLSCNCFGHFFRHSREYGEKPCLLVRAISAILPQKASRMNLEQGDKTMYRHSAKPSKGCKTLSGTSIFIILLAVNDLVICALIIPHTIFINVLLYEADPYGISCKLETALKGSVLSVSMMLLLLIAIERTLVICFVPCKRMHKKLIFAILVMTYSVWSMDAGIMASSRKSSLRNRCMAEKHFLFFDERTFSYYQIAKLSLFFVAMLGVVLLYVVILLFICNLDFKWRMYNRTVYGIQTKTAATEQQQANLTEERSNTSLEGKHLQRTLEREAKLRELKGNVPISISMKSLAEDMSASYSECTSAISTRKARRTCSRRFKRDSKDSSIDSDASGAENEPLCCCQTIGKRISSIKGRLVDEAVFDLHLGKENKNLKHYKTKRRHARTAVMLAVITATFAISYGPYQVLDLVRNKRFLDGNKFEDESSGGRFNLDFLFYHLYFLNSMMNPIIYCFMNASFRAKITKMFCCSSENPI